jgi:hypothetical protein
MVKSKESFFIEKSEKPFFLNINSVLTHFPYFFLKKNLVSKSNYKGVLPKNYEEFELLIEICFKKLDVKKCPIKFERYSAEFHQKYELSTNEYKLLIYLLHDRNKNDLIYFDKVYRDAVAYLDSLLGRLFKYLNDRNGWILCYNNCPTIREMYSRFKIIEPEWSYGMGTSKKSKEILILNY